MPELPEVEAVCRKLRGEALGAVVVNAQFARPGIARPQSVKRIARLVIGQRIEAVRRRGKNIFLDLEGGHSLHVHLRMTGNLHVIPDRRFRSAGARAWFEFEDGRALLYDDPRALGRIHVHKTADLPAVVDTGVEPLDPAFSVIRLRELATRSSQPVKIFLMDQRKIAGLGNIYAAEALFEARIHPRRPARSLSASRLSRLHGAIVGILNRAVQSAVTAYMLPGRFQEAESFPVQVYGREGEPCGVCERNIRRIQQGGRSTYFCPGCQK